jgi:DNA-binding NarL/FixJ family response regulator
VTGPDAEIEQRWRRLRPVRVALDIADRALRADTADACEDAGIAVAASGEADVILIDRPVATALPAVALVLDDGMPDGEMRRSVQAWSANVRAAVPADIDAETLAAVITVVAAGYALTRRDGDDDDGAEDAGDEAAGEPGATLSVREREVLTLLAGGASNKEIALALGLSLSTVKFHVAAITEKLGARSRVDAVAIAVRAGLVLV